MIEEPPGGCHQDVDALAQLLGLLHAAGPPHDEAVGVAVVLQEFLQHTKGLHGQLPCGGDDDTACACITEKSIT